MVSQAQCRLVDDVIVETFLQLFYWHNNGSIVNESVDALHVVEPALEIHANAVRRDTKIATRQSLVNSHKLRERAETRHFGTMYQIWKFYRFRYS